MVILLYLPLKKKTNTMKNLLRTSLIWMLCLGLGLLTNCKKANPLTPGGAANCGANAEKVGTAATAYANDPTIANCEKYKTTVKDFYKS